MANLTRLSTPVHESYDWQFNGACNDADTETFFSPEFERGERRDKRESAAKSYCARCPVVSECLDHAMQAKEPFGIWGGMTTRERQDALRSQFATSA